ncbi:hypothetical protein EU537_02020 [Candidatus Thorarchaeota archaeon]|nr:MAG: hypothetical protein EU537_02020 [Candidatus Thorarchaeota archaeon]
MDIINRFLGLFGINRTAMTGAMSEKSDLKAQIDFLRNRLFMKITGRRLTSHDISSLSRNQKNLDNLHRLSPARRLRRGTLE